jgi:predicted ATPase
MKLARVLIENFRQLGTSDAPLDLSFTDPLGRVRDLVVLVGPNTCGKTTVLDAIAAALGPSLEMPTLRPDFVRSPRTVVRRGTASARVTCWLRFSPDEIRATQELFRLVEGEPEFPVPQEDEGEVRLTWQYPDPRGQHDAGVTDCYPLNGGALLIGRKLVMHLLRTGRVGWDWFRRVGGAFTFDQQRTGFTKSISRQIWNVIQGVTESTPANDSQRTTDPRTILLDLAVRALVPPRIAEQQDEFSLIQQRYAEVCAPRRLIGPFREDDGSLDLRFSDGKNEYGYDGLSSGEQMVLLFLIRMASEHIHRSLVLIDELELNQHPIWQRKLLYLIPRMGDGNQIIATTHSPYLRDVVRSDAVIDLGELGDHSEEAPR